MPEVTVETPQGKLTAEAGGDPDYPEIVITLNGRQIALIGPDDVWKCILVRVWPENPEVDPTHVVQIEEIAQ
jgi:hypothetical protein